MPQPCDHRSIPICRPLVSAAQQRKVLDCLDIGVAEGARIVAQAPLPSDPALAGGYFVAPTLFAGVTPKMRIATEEIFGPFVAVLAFDDEQEAVEIANGTGFGLMAAVYSEDSRRALRVGRQLRAGIVFVNNYNRMITGCRSAAWVTAATAANTRCRRWPSTGTARASGYRPAWGRCRPGSAIQDVLPGCGLMA